MATSKSMGESSQVSELAATPTVHWEDLFQVASNFIDEGQPPIIIMAPFINPHVLKELLAGRNVAVVVTSWRKDHLLRGFSSLATYPVVRAAGAKLLVNDRLHAKLITADFKESLIGSANVTAAGLGTCARSNIEAVVRIRQATPEFKALFCRILIDGRAINDAIYERYIEWLKRAGPVKDEVQVDEPPRVETDPFLIAQLPATRSPTDLWAEVTNVQALTDDAIHDLQLFAVAATALRDDFVASLRSALRSNPFIASLLQSITPAGLYFGALKELVQRMCTDVPMPHRRDLTALVQNLYAWIVEVFPDEFEIVRPNYSQLLRRLH